MSINYTDFYNIFANFFKLTINKLGDVYFIGPDLDEDINKIKTVIRSGNYYTYDSNYGEICDKTISIVLGFIRKNFLHSVYDKGYILKGKYTLYKEKDMIRHDNDDILQIFTGFKYRIFSLYNEYYLSIDPACILLSVASIEYLGVRGIKLDDLAGFSVRYFDDDGHRISGYLIKTEIENGQYYCTIRFYRRPRNFEFPDVTKLPASKLYPEARPELLESFIIKLGTPSSVISTIRRLSFLSSRTPSRDRLVETLKLAESLESDMFPLTFGGFEVSLLTEPLVVKM